MAEFRTEINLSPSKVKIKNNSRLFFLGSCFAENIAHKLIERKFNVFVNPYGIVYNPVSISNVIRELIENREYNANDLLFYNDLWLSLNHHGKFSSPNKEICLTNINNEIKQASSKLKNTDIVFITLGTAIVYTHKNSKQIVANCHKLPSLEFERRLLSVEEIVASFNSVLTRLFSANPHLDIVLTVSPVRHWSEGAVDNQLSKSTLFVAINQLVKTFENVTYFPAYELLMDDLRDYRFYNADMLHPSNEAVNYIWEKFSDSFFDASGSIFSKKMEKLLQAVNHRSFNPGTAAQQRFILKNLEQIKELKKEFPEADLSDLESVFNSQLL